MSVIDKYLQTTNEQNREALEHVRSLVHETFPGAIEEVMSYNMPGFRYIPEGKIVLGFAINKKSLAIYPHSGSALDAMKSDISPYRSALSALQFTPEQPLPDELIKELLAVRIREIHEGYGKQNV